MKQVNLHSVNWQRVVITILVIILLFLVTNTFVQCENLKVADSTIEAQNSEITTYKLKNGKLVASQKVSTYNIQLLQDLVFSKDAEMAEMAKRFSQIKTVTKTVTEFKLDTIEVIYEVPIPCEFERSNTIKHKSYSLDYFVNQNGLKISNLTIPDSVSIVTGIKRKWFLGKETQTIDVTHSNEFIKDKSIEHIEIQEPKKWYNTNAFKIGIGFIGGVLLAK